MTYNRDMQEDKEPVFDSRRYHQSRARRFRGHAPRHPRRMPHACAAAVSDPMLLATDLADYLVLRGVPFRQAHEIIGKSVALCVERGVTFRELSLEDFQKLSPNFDVDVFELLNVRKSIDARQAIGAPSTRNVGAQLQRWREKLSA